MRNFWPIKCLACGVNCDLLTDRLTRIICRDCYNDNFEHAEVESALQDFTDKEELLAVDYQRQFDNGNNNKEGCDENIGEDNK